jgi:hypothetical protein
MFISGFNFNLTHTTISNHQRGEGSGISIASLYGNNPSVTLTNTILVSQTMGITVSVGSLVNINGILWFGNLQNTGGSGVINKTNEYSGDPFFAPDGYHLTPNSAAIDMGVPSGTSRDIDLEPRPYQQFDLGVDEYWPLGLLRNIYLPSILR